MPEVEGDCLKEGRKGGEMLRIGDMVIGLREKR